MKSSIKQFLADLYEIDPTLKSHQDELVPLLEKLLAQDPATAPDAAFVARLRRQLKDRAGSAPSAAMPAWQKFGFFFGGALAAAVIVPVAIMATNQHPLSPNAPLFANRVQATDKNAFGSLNGMTQGAPTDALSARPQGGAMAPAVGEVAPVVAQNAMADNAEASRVMAPDARGDAKMIAPWPATQYQYEFTGAIAGLTPAVDVYKRDSKPIKVPLSAVASSFNFGVVNLNSFDGMDVDNISFVQHSPFGYQMNVNLRDGSVTIDANWEEWPQSKCQTDACWQAERVKLSDLLPDDKVVAIAKDFAAAHGIDVSSFGQPEVDNSWKRDYDRTEDKANAYVPDTQRVVFPQLVDGKPVIDQGGMQVGLSISVSVKQKKVMNVWGIADRSYLKSAYTGVTDEAAIKKYISNVDNYYYDPAVMEGVRAHDKPQTVKVVLGTPTVEYTQYYRYTDNKNEELLIPSLVFPVDHLEGDDHGTYYNRTTVVVPLSADMLAEQNAVGRPIPYMMKGEGDAVPVAEPMTK